MALVLLEEAKTLLAQQQFSDALLKADSAAVMFEQVFGMQHAWVSDAKEIAAKSLQQLGKYAEALLLGEEVLAIRLAVLGENHANTGFAYNTIGILSDLLGIHEKGLEYKLKSLEILEKTSEGTTPDILKAYLNIGAAYNSLGELQTALGWLEKGLDLAKSHFDWQDHEITGHLMMNLGIVLEGMAQFEKGKAWKEKSLNMRLRMYGENHRDVAVAYLNLGNSHHLLGDLPTAVTYTEKALHIYKSFVGEDHPVLANFYNNLGAAYSEMKEFDQSVAWLERSLVLLQKTMGSEHPDVARAYNNLAVAFEELGKHDEALAYFKKSIGLYGQLLGEDHPITIETRSNMGVALQSIGAYDEAIQNYLEILPEMKRLLGEDHFYLSYSYNGLGNAYLSRKDFPAALMAFDTALRIKKKALGTMHPEVIVSMVNMGNALGLNGQFEESLAQYREGFSLLDSIQAVLPLETYYFLTGKLHGGMGAIHFEVFKENGDASRLAEARIYLKAAIEAIKQQKLATVSPNTEKLLAARMKYVAQSAIEASFTGDRNIGDCLYFSEMVKAMQLLETMQEAKTQRLAGIPDSLLEQEAALKIRIAFLEKIISGNAGIPVTDDELQDYKNQLWEARDAFVLFKNRLEKAYPAYHDARYKLPHIPHWHVSDSLLAPSQTLLEYFLGDSIIFIFVINKYLSQVVEIKKDFPLEDWVKQLQQGIYGYFGLDISERKDDLYKQTLQLYADIASKLYEKLVAPVRDKLTEEVIIVPDGALGYVPFEALLTAPPASVSNFSTYPFLLKEHQISYCYSATLLREMKEKQHKRQPVKSLVAFAPFYNDSYAKAESSVKIELDGPATGLDTVSASETVSRREFNELKASGEEAATAAKIWKGDYFLHEDATAQRFRDVAGNYRILHLSTHGMADPRVGDHSYLVFAKPKETSESQLLYVRDLYNLQLNADLVVLSACETAIGELQQGEGIISLARAFAYAGAKSMVTTLWAVDDKASKDLMNGFYLQLNKKNTSKDLALRNAKQALWAGQPSRMHPFFWAGFIAVGDMEAVR